MILISKENAHRLNKEYKIRFGDNGISATGVNKGRRKYYLCESEYNVRCLFKLTSDENVGRLLKQIRENRKKFGEDARY